MGGPCDYPDRGTSQSHFRNKRPTQFIGEGAAAQVTVPVQSTAWLCVIVHKEELSLNYGKSKKYQKGKGIDIL